MPMNDYIQKVLEDHLKDWNGRELRGSCRAGNRRSNAGTVKCAIPSAYPMRIITKSRHVMRAELWRQFGIGMVILVFSVGCATKIPIDPHPLSIESTLNVGDTVEITTTSGSHHLVRVNDITEDAIIGDGHRLFFEVRDPYWSDVIAFLDDTLGMP